MASTSEHHDRPVEDYEPPEVEEISSDAGPAVTAAGDSPPPYGAITLVEEDEDS